ncbi:uridine kinase family protein [Micromonospora coxensis]|uniref:uridine kinase family protein n=1 Tax=Micromonospora coxensis TaxID=356852 RepID=UPI0034347220
MHIDGILAEVARRPAVGGVRIIGVDGPAGAGKSTLAARLAAAAHAPIVEIDDFISWDDPTGERWWPRFDAQVLQPLLRGEDAHFQERDWTDWRGDSLGGWKTVPHHDIVVVEGVTCTRRCTVGRLAFAVFVEAPEDVRLRRGLARDHGQSYDVEALWRAWMVKEQEFFAADGTRERADLIVQTGDGSTPV